jgi:hypothetical protein
MKSLAVLLLVTFSLVYCQTSEYTYLSVTVKAPAVYAGQVGVGTLYNVLSPFNALMTAFIDPDGNGETFFKVPSYYGTPDVPTNATFRIKYGLYIFTNYVIVSPGSNYVKFVSGSLVVQPRCNFVFHIHGYAPGSSWDPGFYLTDHNEGGNAIESGRVGGPYTIQYYIDPEDSSRYATTLNTGLVSSDSTGNYYVDMFFNNNFDYPYDWQQSNTITIETNHTNLVYDFDLWWSTTPTVSLVLTQR